MTEVQEQEISFDQSVEEEAEAAQVVDPGESDETQPEQDVLDILVPKKDPKTWIIGQGDYQRTYVQRKLSFIAKMQWFALVGDVLDGALSGPTKMSMNSLLRASAGARRAALCR